MAPFWAPIKFKKLHAAPSVALSIPSLVEKEMAKFALIYSFSKYPRIRRRSQGFSQKETRAVNCSHCKGFQRQSSNGYTKRNFASLNFCRCVFQFHQFKIKPHPSRKNCFEELKLNDIIIITKAVRGGQIVVLDKNHYIESVNVLLNDGPYITLSHDPSL